MIEARLAWLILILMVGTVCVMAVEMANDIVAGKYSWALIDMALCIINERQAVSLKRKLDRYG